MRFVRIFAPGAHYKEHLDIPCVTVWVDTINNNILYCRGSEGNTIATINGWDAYVWFDGDYIIGERKGQTSGE